MAFPPQFLFVQEEKDKKKVWLLFDFGMIS